MPNFTINFDDDLYCEVMKYIVEHNITFEEMTKKLWLDFLAEKAKNLKPKEIFGKTNF